MMNTQDEKVRQLEEVHLLDYAIVLAKHSRKIIYTTFVVGLITLVAVFLFPKKYTAVARIVPPQQNLTLSGQIMEGLGGAMIPGRAAFGTLGGFTESLLGLKTPGDFFVGLLQSDTIFDRIIARFDLRQEFEARYIEEARAQLENIAKFRATKYGLITVEVTHRSPARAAEMANAFLEELSRLLRDMADQEASERLAFLDQERREASARLAKAEEDLRQFSEKNSVLLPDAQTRGMLEYIAGLKAAIDYREVELQVYKQWATPFNFQVQQVEAELKALKEKLRQAEGPGGGPEALSQVMIAVGRMPALGLEYLRLYREVKYQEGLYRVFAKLTEIARLDHARDALVLQVVDRATAPERKSSPKRLLILLVVTGSTFLLMVAATFLLEHFRNVPRSPEDLDRAQRLRAALEPWRRDLRRLTGRGARRPPGP
jgi:capsule polysaccharide export protein KpsE/RkpR